MAKNLTREDAGNGIILLKLNRAPVNALTPKYLKEIEKELLSLNNDSDVRALIITSSLGVFSAGMDLKAALAYDNTEQTAIVDGLNKTFACLYGFSKPVIVAVNGATIAGGMFFVLSSDYTVSGKNARFGLTEVRVGVTFPLIPLEIIRSSLSPAALRRLVLSGELFSAVEAENMGIVDKIKEPDDVIPHALRKAESFAKIPPQTFANIKKQIRGEKLQIMHNIIIKKTDETRLGWYSQETKSAMTNLLKATTKG